MSNIFNVFVLLSFLAVATAFVDRNVQDFERRRLLEERRQQEAERQRQAQGANHRYYRSLSHIDLEPNVDLEYVFVEPYTLTRQKRSQLPNTGGINIERSGDDTISTIKIAQKTDKYDIGAIWKKVLHGPHRGKPNFSIGGTYRW